MKEARLRDDEEGSKVNCAVRDAQEFAFSLN
jgi:hypothetical protein